MAGKIRKAVAAVDVGGTKIRTALVAADLAILSERVRPSVSEPGGSTLQAVEEEIAFVLAGLPGLELAAIGVGSPGVVHPQTLVTSHSGLLTGWPGLRIRERLAGLHGVPVAVENDVNMAAVAEHRAGRARGVDDFVFVAVGTGVGAGVFAGGRLCRGRHGACGEIGYLPVRTGSSPARMLESVASGTGIGEAGHAAGLAVDSRGVFLLAKAGDERARGILGEAGRVLGHAVADVCRILDPDMVVLGGGVMENPQRDLLLNPFKEALCAGVLFPPRIAVSDMGNRAPVIGAACLAWQAAGEPR